MPTEATSTSATADSKNLWEAYAMALDDVTDRLHRITRALAEKSVPYAVVGGQAVALGWPQKSLPPCGPPRTWIC